MLEMKWDNMGNEMKEWYLSKACLNSNLARYKWEEIEDWIKEYIRDAFKLTPHIKLIE